MSHPTVLYAEDDENDAFLMERAFKKADLTNLQIVSDGQRSIEYLSGVAPFNDREKFPLPSLVLLDINMPRLSGLEALTWIRAQSAYLALPVVMFTSSTQEKDSRTAYSLGATAYVVKPNNAGSLVEFVKLLKIVLQKSDLSEADFSGLPSFSPR